MKKCEEGYRTVRNSGKEASDKQADCLLAANQ